MLCVHLRNIFCMVPDMTVITYGSFILIHWFYSILEKLLAVISCHHSKVCHLHISRDLYVSFPLRWLLRVSVLQVSSLFPTNTNSCSHIYMKQRNHHFLCSLSHLPLSFWLLYIYTKYTTKVVCFWHQVYVSNRDHFSKTHWAVGGGGTGAMVRDNPLGSPSSDWYGLRELFFDRNPFFQNQINEHLHMVIIVFLSNWINRPSSGFFVVGSMKSEIINLYSILHHKQCNFQWKC